MKCKNMKKEIRKLEHELKKTREQFSYVTAPEQRYNFDVLEIMVRPRHDWMMQKYEAVGIDLRVAGDGKVPTVCAYKTISLSSLDVLLEHKEEFTRHVAEIMLRELEFLKR